MSCGAGAIGADKPNIVFIMADDLGYNELGFTSVLNNTTTQFRTPRIDELAQQSVIASQAYAAAPLCSTSRAGLLTGIYHQRFGFEDNLGSLPGDITIPNGLSPEQITMAQRMKDLGYTTGAVGKWHIGYVEGFNRPLDVGFDEFYGTLAGQRPSFFSNQTTLSAETAIRRGNQYYEQQFRTEGDADLYDPVKGRYVTDAFGEEAADFISNHSGDANPFFLYVPLTAPHVPLDYKQSDWEEFPNITNETQRRLAAMTFAMDRAVGMIVDRLKDPNKDGNQSDSVFENTIVVFTNDNGGAPINSSYHHDNTPYAGVKGFTWEGGIRVPFTIKAPGLQPGVYHDPITHLDMLPTFVNAAGGDMSGIPTDGYDIMPLLTGEQTVNPHDTMFWRSLDAWAVRQGNWKLLVFNQGNVPGPWLYNLDTDPGELNSVLAQHPEIAAVLVRELTFWEAELAKPKWLLFRTANSFDHFVFRNDLAATTNWNTANAWKQGGTTDDKTLFPWDAYANAILEFPVRNDADYTANNNMDRMTRQTFMLNELQFTGEFNGAVGRQGTITGKPLLFVKTLAGQLPRILLDATASGTSAKFTYNINNELRLLDNLEITGNGTQNFVINGPIVDFWEPRNVLKSGTSQVTLAGNNAFKGTLTVNGGTVRVFGAGAAINGAAGIVIGSGGTLTLDSGTIAVGSLDNSAGGAFNFNGGLLKVLTVTGNLANNGGTFAPGASPALATISGNFADNSGVLQIEFSTTGVDRLQIGGTATLGGTLDVDLLSGFMPTIGQAFELLAAAGGRNGSFANTDLPALTGGKTWNLLYGAKNVILAVGPASGTTFIPGDYNRDGTVDAADYVVWRKSSTTGNLMADGNGNGAVDAGDVGVWRSNFGLSLVGGSGSVTPLGVPEPTTATLLLVATIALCAGRRVRRSVAD